MNWFGRIKRKYIGAGLNNTASENPAVRHVPLQLICPPAGWALFNPDPFLKLQNNKYTASESPAGGGLMKYSIIPLDKKFTRDYYITNIF